MTVTDRTRLSGRARGFVLWRALLLPALGVLLAGAVGADAADPGRVVVVITPHNEGIRHEFAEGFARWHRSAHGEPARVEWRDIGGTADSLRFVQSEFTSKPQGIGIDVFFGGGSEPFLLLADRGLLQACTLPAPVLAGIPQNSGGIEIYDPQHRWYGAALSSFGILQNRAVQRRMNLPAVDRWAQLGDPLLFGWVAIGDPRNSGTMNNMFEAFLQAQGWETGWEQLTRIAANARQFDRVSSSTAKDVTLGQTAYGFAVDFYAFTQIAMAGRTNMAYVLPSDFTAVSPDGIAVLKGAPDPVAAGRFLEFVLGETGQKLWLLPRGHAEGARRFSIERMPVRPDLYVRYRAESNIQFSPFELAQSFRYNARLAQDRREIVAALAGALLVDTQTELRAAWAALREQGVTPENSAALGTVPISAAEALRLASGPWKDPVFRNERKIAWQAWARDKYRALAGRHALAAVPR